MEEIVTFRKEGVDWNYVDKIVHMIVPTSPSARKVWIEIRHTTIIMLQVRVTFRKEGVDWNFNMIPPNAPVNVTFRKEGVDWNEAQMSKVGAISGHLPQGRCGLK